MIRMPNTYLKFFLYYEKKVRQEHERKTPKINSN